MEAETCPKPLIEAPLSSTSSCSSSSSSEVKPTSPSSRKRSRSSLEGTQKGAESTSKEETEGAVCGICFEQPGKVKGKLDSCVHTFCFDCIHRWSKIKNTCPYCNARFSHIIKEREPTGRNGRHRKKQVRVRRTDPSFSDDELPFGGFGMNDPLNFFGLISLMLRGRATANFIGLPPMARSLPVPLASTTLSGSPLRVDLTDETRSPNRHLRNLRARNVSSTSTGWRRRRSRRNASARPPPPVIDLTAEEE